MAASTAAGALARTGAKPLAFLIRQFEPRDQQGVNRVFVNGCEFYRDSFPAHVQDHWTEFVQGSLDDDLARIPSVYIAPGGNFWVVTTANNEEGSAAEEEQESIVGIVGLEAKGEGEGELRRMAVSSAYRRHGLGRQLVAELESWAKSNGFTRVTLMNGGPKDHARVFYRSLGYQQIGMKVVSVEPHIEAVEFAKDL